MIDEVVDEEHEEAGAETDVGVDAVDARSDEVSDELDTRMEQDPEEHNFHLAK